MPKKRKSFSSRLGPPTTYLVHCPRCGGSCQDVDGKCRLCKKGKVKQLVTDTSEWRFKVIQRTIEDLQAEAEGMRQELTRLSSPYVRL